MNLKKVRSAIRNFILAAGLVVPLFSTVSCEIGLGESVDTQAPVISITYPPVGATIMEDFILSGTYADDKGITGVTVTIQGTGIDNGNFSMGPLAATYADNIWQINLNKSNGTGIYNGYDIPDGPIEVTVNVSDGGNHTTTEKRALEIDNTAPILILAKPLSTAQDASATTYGRVLKLTGDIYDLHQSNGISVKLHYALYDREAGTIGDVKTLDGYSINSSMTDDSPLIIAQYYPTNEANDDAKKAMRQNYITLYGTDADAGNGHTLDKIFYCGVQLTDCAKVYRNPADQTGADKGNTTERYYINSTNFYNELQSESSTRTGGKNFNISATKIAKMFNGTGTEYSADDKAVIIDVLNTKGNWSTSVAENINTEESSKFLINPDNSPTWNVSGYELGNALGDAVTGFRALAQGSSVSFNINAGKDNTLIRPETVSVKLRHYTSFESYKSGVSSGDDVILLEKGTWSENDAATAISQQFTPTGKDVTLRAGEFYVFVVEGIDRNTNDVVSADGAVYGFMVKRAETPPELYDVSTREIIGGVPSAKTIDEAAGGFTDGKKEIKISGKVKMLGQEFAEDTPVAVSYTCSNLLDSSQVIGDLGTEITVNRGEVVDDMADWEVVLGGKLCPDAPSKYKITVNIVIKNASDITSATERINFYVDNMEPEVKNEKVSPYVVVDESNVLNGNVKYSASITDNNEVADENIGTWFARNGDAEIASGPIDKTDFTTTAIDTTRIGETGTLTIEADACDKVGNLKKHIKTYAVDQKTDKPVITPGNYKTDVAADDIKVNSNLFGITSNNKIYATITDDDGIARVRVYRRLLPAGTEELIMDESGDGMLTYALTINLNTFTVEGKYEFRVEVDDKLGETDYSKIKDRDHVFNAGVSSGAPSIQRTTQDDLYVSTSSPCIVKGNVDVKAIKVLRHTTVNASDDGVPVTTYTAGDSSWEDSYLAPEAKGGKVYYFAYDVFGQTTAATFTYRIDVKNPTVAPDWAGPADAKKWTNASSVAFKIPLSDEWDNTKNEVIDSLSSSGIESASYWVDTYNPAGDPSGPLAGRNQYNDSKYGNKYMNYDATIEFTDGKHKVYVLVKDNAGNKLEIKDDSAYEYWIDTTPPVIDSVEKSIIDDKTLNISDVDNLSTTPVTITVAANDGTGDVSGIKEYKLVENNKELLTVAANDANAGVFSLTKAILTHGDHSFTVRAYDKAGNYSDSDPVEIRVDSTKPVASVTSVTPTVTVKEGSGNKTYVNGVISISGSASDETALGTADGTIEVFVDDVSIGNATLTGQSWTLKNYNTKDLTDNTEHKIKVVVTDKAGNKGESELYTINVKQSTDTPVVEPSNYKTNISADELETNKNLFGKTSNNKLIANITDDDGIDKIKVYYKKNSDSVWTPATPITVSTVGNIEKSYTLNYDLSAHEEGKWNFKIEVTDVLKETNSEYMNTPVVFNIGVSDGAPAISLTTADNTWQQPNTPFPVTGNVASKAVKIELRKDGNVESLDYRPGITTWSHSIKSTEGATVHFVAIDEFKQENSIPFTYKIDSHDPTIASDWTNTDANHGSPETVVWRNSGNLKLEIPVSDSWDVEDNKPWGENSISGIKEVYYTVDGGAKEGTTEGNLYGDGNKANYRYYKTTLAFAADGRHEVEVFVVDDAARIINRTYVYNIDTNAPKITSSQFSVDGNVSASTVNKSNLDNMTTKKIKITANVSDLVVDGITHVSGIKTVELYDGNTKVNINPTVSSGVYTFEFPNEGVSRTILSDGTHTFTVRATDNVGNSSTSPAIMVTVDGTLPSAAVSGVSPTVTKDTTTYINGIVKFTGTVSDNSALGTSIDFLVDGEKYGESITVDSDLTYKAWEMSVDTRYLTDDVEHKFTVKVSDTAGNQATSAEYKVTVDQDTDIPAIAFANLSAGDNVFGSDGKDKITFTVTEDDLIKSIKVYVDGSATASYVYEPASPELSTKTVSLNVTASANDVAKGDIKLDEEGIHKINIVVEDNLLRTGESAKKTGDTEFILDNSVPDLSETKIGESGLVTNGGDDKKIVISLTAADGYGLKKIEITDSMNASSKWELTPESGELKSMTRNQEISFGSDIGKLADGNHVITIKATDLAGKTTQIKRNVTVDTVNPKFEKVSDSDEAAAPKITTTSKIVDDKAWYKSQQVSLKVMTSDDSGSGVSNVEWTTDDAASESAVWSSLTKDSGTEGLWAGTVTPLVQGANRITVRITDRAGNSTSAELYPYVDTEVPAETVLVKVDDVDGADVDRKIVNGTADVVVLLKAKDTGSVAESKATGIGSVSVSRIGSTAITDVDGTPTANADEFKIVIPKEKLATGMVIVKATDKVGNFLETSLFQMELDNTPPKVKISNPASAKTGADIYVNRKISFSGTSSDKNLDDASRPTLEYSRWNGSAWGEWKLLNVTFTLDTTAGTWTTNSVNTETAFVITDVETKVPDGSKVKVRATITDKAGNLCDVTEKENETDTKPQCETKEFIVDQNTDRPVIRVTSPNTFQSKNAVGALVDMSSSVYAWQKNLTYISGIVIDDDGSLTKKDDKGRLYYSTQTNRNPATAGDWTELDAESGSWQINFVDSNGNPDDGKFTVHFMVKDNEGAVYTSTTSVDRDKSIILTDGTNEYGAVGSEAPKNNTVFYIGIDNSAPVVSNVEYTMFSKKRNDDSKTNTLFGGDTTKFKLKLNATDTNGIKKVTISHENFGASDPIVLEKDAVDAKGNGTYKTRDYIDISDTTKWTSGTYTFKVTAVDMADLEKVENISINIDNDAPEVTMTSPTLDERSKPTDPGAPVVDTVWGANVKATGAVNGTRKLYYAISTTDKVRPYMPVETLAELTDSANFDTKLEDNFTDAQKTELTKWTGRDIGEDGGSTPKADGTLVAGAKTQRPSYVTKDKDDKLVYREFNEFKTSAPSSWKLAFDGDDDPSNITTTHTKKVNDWLVDLGVTTKALIEDNTFTTYVNLYLWIWAEDDAGNVTERSYPIEIDPQGSRPKIDEITNPEVAGTKVTGKVRVSGSATDDVKVKGVWLQFISAQHNLKKNVQFDTAWDNSGRTYGTVSPSAFNFTKDDLDYMAAAGMKVFKIKDYKYDKEVDAENQAEQWTVGDSLKTGETASDYAAFVKPASSSWNLKINTNSEFAPANKEETDPSTGETITTPTTNNVAFRVFAHDGEFLSLPRVSSMVFDTESPEITGLTLVQYGEDGTTVSAQRAYKEDMFINSSWWLEGYVKDDTVSDLDVLGTELMVDGEIKTSDDFKVTEIHPKTEVTDKSVEITAENIADYGSGVEIGKIYELVNGEIYHTYKFALKLDTSTIAKCGLFKGKVEATDNAGHNATPAKITINVDKNAPAIVTMYEYEYNQGTMAAVTENAGGKKVFKKHKYGEKYNVSPLVQNSDGYYTFGSQVMEESVEVTSNGIRTLYNQSGFARVAFYFMRRNSGGAENNQWLYDIMEDSSRVNVKDLGTSGLVFEDGLYWVAKRVTPQADRNIVTGDFGDVRKGSLVKINGAYYTTTDESNSTQLVLSEELPGDGTAEITALVAKAQVVDHLVMESAVDGTVRNDDGDGMVESVKKTGTTWTWDASVNTKTIEDGPIELHYVVFDDAGNYSVGIVGNSDRYEIPDGTTDDRVFYRKDAINICNRAPRLSKVFLGTDLNGDNSYTQSEFVEYDIFERNGRFTTAVDLETRSYTGKSFRIKDKFAVMPEFVGGNNIMKDAPIKVVFSNDATKDEANYVTSASPVGPVDDPLTTKVNTDKSGNDVMKLVLSDEVKTTWNDRNNWAADGSKNSGAAKYDNESSDLHGLDYYMYLYEFQSADEELGAESTDEEVNGGIGKRQMSFTFWDNTTDTVQGTSSNYCYLKIKDLIVDVVDTTPPLVKINPFHWNSKSDCSVPLDEETSMPLGHIDLETAEQPNPKVSGQVIIRGTAYDNTRHGGIYISDPSASDSKQLQVAKFEKGEWSEVKDNWPEYWKKFEIVEDYGITQDGHTVEWEMVMDMTTFGVDTGKILTAKAVDAKGNDCGYAGDTVAQTKKDALTAKYVMDFVPYIKGVKDANRSRLGRYPVRAGQEIVVEGMNFAKGAKYQVKFYNTANGTKPTGSRTAQSYSYMCNATADSGTWEGTIPADGEITIKAPKYSAYFEVKVTKSGSTTDYVETSNNNNQNIKWNIEEGTLDSKGKPQITPGKNQWNDDRYLSVWNVVSTIPSNKHAKPTAGVFVKSKEEKISRVISNGSETKNNQAPNNAVKDLLIATWGSSDELQMFDYPIGSGAATVGNTAYGKSEACFFEAPPQLDTCIVNGLPWYVVLDNYAGGNSANAWGAGLYIARQGFDFTKDNFKATTSQHPYIIEAQGKEGKHDMAGVDEKKNQFINPHIAGYFDRSNEMYYMYISYYDTYARCLKYAAYKEKINKDSSQGNVSAASWQDYTSETSAGYGKLVGMMNGHAILKNTEKVTIQGTGANVVAGNDVYTQGVSSWTEQVGEYNDILIDPTDNVPVIVYYNKSKKGLQIARASGAFTTIAQAPGSGEAGAKTWVYTGRDKVIRPTGVTSDFGRYISAEVDDKGNLHIAAQEVNSGKLYYLYMTKSGSTYTLANSYLVDSTSAVGNWTDIHLGKDDANSTNWYAYEPVISYLDKSNLNTTSAAKVAWVETATVNGVVSASWEAMTDPAQYEGFDNKTSVAGYPSEGKSGIKSKLAVGFNSDYYAVDFLRGE
nr:Ig-like domain repeat protein [uncultured Treponema sp.]